MSRQGILYSQEASFPLHNRTLELGAAPRPLAHFGSVLSQACMHPARRQTRRVGACRRARGVRDRGGRGRSPSWCRALSCRYELDRAHTHRSARLLCSCPGCAACRGLTDQASRAPPGLPRRVRPSRGFGKPSRTSPSEFDRLRDDLGSLGRRFLRKTLVVPPARVRPMSPARAARPSAGIFAPNPYFTW
jgi:hypothetical protein